MNQSILKFLLTGTCVCLLISCERGVENERVDLVVPQTPEPIIRGESEADQALFIPIETQTITLNIRNAKTDSPIEGTIRFNIDEINDKKAIALSDDVLPPDLSKGETYQFVSENSSLNIQLLETLYDESFPIILRIQVEAEGYFSTGKTVYINQSDITVVESINLTNKENPPDDVVIAQSKGTIGAGGLNQSIDVTTDNADEKMDSVGSFQINTANELKDADGNPLKPGEVTIEVAYFDPEAENVEALFPGGISFENDTEIDVLNTSSEGTEEGGVFTTAGLMAVDITDTNGNKAHDLGGDTAATLRFTIPPTLLNPETGEPVRAGDIIPIWSRDEETGQWAMEDATTEVQQEGEELYIEYQTGHLSYWNLDWYGARCPNQRQLSFSALDGSSFEMPYTGGITIEMSNTTRNYYRVGTLRDPDNTIYNSPSQGTTTFTAYTDRSKTVQLGTVVITGCDSIDILIDKDKYPVPPDPIDLQFELSIISPRAVNYWEAERLMQEAKVKRDRREDILNTTHPGSLPEVREWWPGDYSAYRSRYTKQTFDAVYQELLNRGLMDREEISTVQSVQATEFKLKSAHYNYRVYDAYWSLKASGSGQMDNGIALLKDIYISEGDIFQISASGRIFDAEDDTTTYFSGYSKWITVSSGLINQGGDKIQFESPVASAVIYKALVNDTIVEE